MAVAASNSFRHALEDIVVVSEVDDGPAFANHIFQRKYRLDAPRFEHHVVAFYRKAEDLFVPASYEHFWIHADVGLIGGACTDGRVFEHMPQSHRDRIRDSDGLHSLALRYGLAKYADRCEAFFGICNNPRALAVDMQAGFEATAHQHLIVKWHKPLSQKRQAELIEQALSVGPF